MNIVYINQIPYVTDKETFPTKPQFSEPPFQPPYKPYGMSDEEMEYEVHVARNKMEEWQMECSMADEEYNQSVADFIRDCTPIVKEDWEKVREAIKIMLVNTAPFSESQRKWLLTEPLFVMQGKREDQLTKDELRWYNADKGLIVDHTIYKVEGLEFEEVQQLKTVSGNWVETYGGIIPECELENPVCEYRRAFKIVEDTYSLADKVLNDKIGVVEETKEETGSARAIRLTNEREQVAQIIERHYGKGNAINACIHEIQKFYTKI
jgi:hypothetical protein